MNKGRFKVYIFSLCIITWGLTLVGQSLNYSTSPDISTAVFSGTSFSVGAQEPLPLGLAFNNGGTKMFVVGAAGEVNEYLLSVAFNVSSATFSNGFSVAAQDSDPRGLTFNNDGTVMYVVGRTGDAVYQYGLIVAFDVSSVVFTSSFSVGVQESDPSGLVFNNGGTRMFVVGFGGDAVYEYGLGVAFEVNTAVFTSSFSVGLQDVTPNGLDFNHDGTKMYMVGSAGDAVYEYGLSVAFDVSSAVFTTSFSVLAQEATPQGLTFNNSGTKMFVVGNSNAVFEYNLSSNAYVEAPANDGSIEGSLIVGMNGDTFINAGGTLTSPTHFTINNLPAGLTPSMAVSTDGLTGTLSLTGSAITHQDTDDVSDLQFTFTDAAFAISAAAAVNNAIGFSTNLGIDFNDTPILTYSTSPDVSTAVFSGTSFSVATQEVAPNGLAFNRDGTKMYVVGSAGDAVYEYGLSTAFDVSSAIFTTGFSVAAQETVPQGVTFNNGGTKMYMVGSAGAAVYEYTLSVAFEVSGASVVFSGTSFSVVDQESTPLGLAFNNDGTKMYVVGVSGDVNEYTLSVAFDVSSATFSTFFSVAAQESDLRGLTFNNDGSRMYIVGRTGDAVYEYDMSVAFDVSSAVFTTSFPVGAQESDPTGFTFNNKGTRMFVVGFDGDAVYEYDLSSNAFTEAPANDGSVEGSLIVSLSNDTFVNAGGSLTSPTHFTINNLPAGLTPIMAVGTDGLTATLTLSGNASAHQDTDDVIDLQFTFTDAAFTNSTASIINNAIGASSNLGIDFNDNPIPSLTYATSPDVTTIVFSGTTFSVAAQGAPLDLAFNIDGTKMYVIAGINGINEFVLSTPFDVSTASFTTNFSVATQDTQPHGLRFNNDGTKMYVVGAAGNNVYEYTLSTAFDVSTSIFATSFSVAGQIGQTTSLAFNNDGSKMYVSGATNDAVYEYNLSTGFEISSAIFSTSFSVTVQEVAPEGLAFSNDGTKMFVAGNGGDDVNEYTLSTAFDVSTASITTTSDLLALPPAEISGLAFNSQGTKMFVTEINGRLVKEYDLSSNAFTEAPANDGSVEGSLIVSLSNDTFTNAGGSLTSPTHFTMNNLPAGLTPTMTVSTDGLTATLGLTGNATAHEDANDVNDLQFTFTDAAFTNSAAAIVNNAIGASSNLGIDFNDAPTLTYATSPDISTAAFSGTSFSVAAQETGPTGLAFNNDGTKMYVVGFDGDAVNEYALSTAFDVNTASFTTSFSVAAQETSLEGLAFNNDGTKMYVVGSTGDAVHQYTLSTSFDVNSASFTTSFSVAAQEIAPTGLAFNNDGTKMYIMGNIGDAVDEYALSTAFDVSTASFTTRFSVAAQETSPEGLAFNNDGTKMYVVGATGDAVHQYTLSTAFDVNSASFTTSFSVAAQDIVPQGLAFNNHGTKMYVVGSAGDNVYEYNLSSNAFTEAPANDGSVEGSLIVSLSNDTFTNAGGSLTSPTHFIINNLPAGLTPTMAVGTDGLTATLTLAGNANNHQNVNDINDLQFTFTNAAFTSVNVSIINNAIGASSTLGIDFEANPSLPSLTYSTSPDISTATFSGTTFSVAAQETSPTGLAFNNDGTKMYVFGTGTRAVNEYALSTAFDVSSAGFTTSFSVAAQDISPQGLAFNNDGTKMYVVGLVGQDVNEYALSMAFNVNTASFTTSFSVAAQETSPAGLGFNNDGMKMYVLGVSGDDVNEYALGTAFDLNSAGFTTSFSVAAQDNIPLGLAFNKDGTKMYVAGAGGGNINEYTLGTAFDVSSAGFTTSFSVAAQETSPRGLAFNNDGTKMYVMGSAGDAVNEYNLSSNAFTEALANDGSVGGSIIVSISNDTFANAGGTLTLITHFTINNLPAGLTPTMAVGTDGLTATLTLAGNANNHQNVNDINDLQFTFTNAAFTSGNVSIINNAIGASSTLGIDFEANPSLPSLTYSTSPDISTATFSGTTFSVQAQESSPQGLAFNNDGTKMYVVGTVLDNVNEYALSTAFDVSSAGFTTSFSVAAQDGNPRDLAFNNDGTKMYVVGTTGDNVNEYALSTAFDVSSAGFPTSFSVAAQETEPQGLAFNTDGTKMYVVGQVGNAVNEYALSTAFDVSSAGFTTSFSVAAQDAPSGLAFNSNGTKMYVVGTFGVAVHEYVLNTAFAVSSAGFTTSFSVSAEEPTPQGLAFNNDGTKMYVVGSSGDDVNVYDLSSNAFTEAPANDGSVERSLIVSIINDTFTGGTLTSPTHFTINNLPAGLVPTMVVSTNGLTATLTLAGNATANENVNDVIGLQFTFTDAAFTNSAAAVVSNAIGASTNLGIDFNDFICTVFPVISNSITNNTACDPLLSNGSISASNGGVITGHTFEWFTGTGTSTPFVNNTDGTISGTSGETISGLASSNYTVRITINATGCSSTQTFAILDNSTVPVIDQTKVIITDLTSCSSLNGSLAATDILVVSDPGGEPGGGYTFEWWIGTTATGATDFTSDTYSNLGAGDYTLVATNNDTGCKSTPVTFTLADLCVPVPTITSFSPSSGPVGTSVTITGTNFDATPANNIVFFGATQATVTAATTTDLTVTVPTGATYQPITVLTNGLLAFSDAPFVVTFTSDGTGIDVNSFEVKVDLASGLQPFSVSIGDLDGDGKADLAAVNFSSSTVSVFRNISTGTGSISYAAKVDFTTGLQPVSVSIGDLDGDGKADLAVANLNNSTVSVFRNTSTGAGSINYATKVDFTTGSDPRSVSIGDLDGDGKADLAVANQNSNTISVFRNTSTGAGSISYAAKIDFATATLPFSVSIGDLDGDGKADLAVANQQSNSVSVFRNTSTGAGSISYASKVDFTTGSGPESVSIGDLDGDSKSELVVANATSNTVTVLRNTSTGAGSISYATKVDFTTGSDPNYISIGDLDGDGKVDLAVANKISGTVSILRNTSTGPGTISYGAKVDFTTGSEPRSVSTGDLDGDGKADLAVASFGSNAVSVFRNAIIGNNTPTDISLSSQTVNEEQAIGLEVGTLSTTDVDAGDTHTYTLVTGTGDTDNASFSITGNQLLTAEVFDFETKTSYSVRIQTDDGNGGTFQKAFTITINDINELGNDVPTDISLSALSIDENQSIGTQVGTLSTTDADPGDTHTYSLVAGTGDTDNTSFSINGTQLLTAEVFDFETKASYSVRIQTDDGNGGTFPKVFTITVNDINEGADTENPVITIVSLPTEITKGDGQINASIKAADNSGTVIVTFHYKEVSNRTFTTPVPVTADANQDYIQAILETWLNDAGIDYFFRAEDATGNFITTDTITLSLVIPSSTAPDIENVLGQGANPSDWRMFSIPYELLDKSINSIFEAAIGSPNGGIDWRILHWDPVEDNFRSYQESTFGFPSLTTIERGKGYWFLSRANISSLLAGASNGTVIDTKNLFSMSLKEGWNQVGNPYPFDMSWDAVRTANGFDNTQIGDLVVFSGSQNTLVAAINNRIQAFQGAYVQVLPGVGDVNLNIPIETGGRTSLENETPWGLDGLDQLEWQLPLILESPGFSNFLGGIGMRPDASERLDEFDMGILPLIKGFPQMSFSISEGQSVTKSIIDRKVEFQWSFKVEAEPEELLTLKWDNQYFGINEFELILFDTETFRITDLRYKNEYQFTVGNNKELEIYYGSSDYIKNKLGAKAIILGNNFPNPVEYKTIIPFNLPASSLSYNVNLSVYDTYGRKLQTIVKGDFMPGYHEIEWDLSNISGHLIKSGLYLYIIEVQADRYKQILSKILILK